MIWFWLAILWILGWLVVCSFICLLDKVDADEHNQTFNWNEELRPESLIFMFIAWPFILTIIFFVNILDVINKIIVKNVQKLIKFIVSNATEDK